MHEHRLILIREFSGQHNVRWCYECGLVFESFGGETFAEIVPQWSEERLLKEDRSKEKYSYASERELKTNRSQKRLGRGLKDIIKQQPSFSNQLLLGPHEKLQDKKES